MNSFLSSFWEMATSPAQLDSLLGGSRASVVYFWAEWCRPCKQMDAVCEVLAKDHPVVKFVKVNADESPTLLDVYGIDCVPAFVLLKGKDVVAKVSGSNAPELSRKVKELASAHASAEPTHSAEPVKESLTARLEALTQRGHVMLFMKGTPDQPRCGFSAKAVHLLRSNGVIFESFDILSDEQVRQGLKEFSHWPTYPQLYVRGKLIGGVDVMEEMNSEGELAEVCAEA